MGNLDRSGISMAIRLLAKAESTDSEDEAIALALRSYSLLAQAINTYDLTDGGVPKGARRRERRLLVDRRSAVRVSAEETAEAGDSAETAAAHYARLANRAVPAQGAIDLSL
ncbi:MAG: hypothetical protein ABSB52_04495 [Acidimicrobiales bacterium]|jgi:hypothetical protein